MRRIQGRTVSPAVLLALLFLITAGVAAGQVPARTMSYSNRQLLNRAVVGKEDHLEVMLLAESGKLEEVKKAVLASSGSVIHEDVPTGYLRISVPTANFASLIANPVIAAYQISTGANMIWTQEGRSEQIAKMYRGYEGRPLGGEPSTVKVEAKNLPTLSVPESRAYGYTAEEDTGVGDWLAQHPTWDGRGVTIAMLESGEPEFQHPTLRSAKSLDGKDVPKIAGVVNTVDQSDDDNTRVEMKTVISTARSWYTIAGRTYILPHPGTFRFGIFYASGGGNVREEFAVLWDQKSGDIWVDSDGDANFRNNDAMREVNERFDVGQLSVTVPEKKKIPFVLGKSTVPDTLHLYPAIAGHTAMTASVAAGSRTEDGVASGVAPNARILFVRSQAFKAHASDFVEGYIDIERRPDVDVLSDSRGVMPVPDMGSEFYGMVFQRIVAAYGKPIFHSGGNGLPGMGKASALDGVFSVGGSIGPATYEALFGGGKIDRELKHPLSSEGPGIDGTLKPDFIAPMHRVAAKTCMGGYSFELASVALPKNDPKVVLPPCYDISCCTSASGPYAAGMAALLMSAARQKEEQFSVETLGRALRASAHFLAESPAYTQGTGLLNIRAAWDELNRKVETPRIKISAPLVHPLAAYAQHSREGGGLLEVSGWAPGQNGERLFHFRRESGPAGPTTYRLTWTGNDGTFKSATAVTLPLNQSVALPVQIGVRAYGAHSAILNLHDPQTNAIVARGLATIVAPQPVSPGNHAIHFEGSVPLMRSDDHFVSVPSGTEALKIELLVKRGSLAPDFVSMDPSQSTPNRSMNMGATAKKMGRYTWVYPRPSTGTWTFTLTNDSAWREKDPKRATTESAEYELTISALKGSLTAAEAGTNISLQAENLGAMLTEPVADIYSGLLLSTHAEFSSAGVPNLFEFEAPENAGILQFRVKADAGASDLEAFLYNCTSGECFFSDYAGIAAHEQQVTVRNPKAGKWILAVNAAPVAVGHGGFVVERISGGKPYRQTLLANSNKGTNAWHASLDKPALEQGRDLTPVLLCELVDASLERAEAERIAALYPQEPKDKDKEKEKGKDAPDEPPTPKPAAIASTVLLLK